MIVSTKSMSLQAFILLVTAASTTDAALIANYAGTEDTSLWSDGSLWQTGQSPVANDEAWMNTDDTQCTIRSTPAQLDKLIIARKAQNVLLNVENNLTIGSLLFMGQYVDNDGSISHGTTVVKRGHVKVLSGELSVGVSAAGTYQQLGGTTIVDGHCKVGRYNRVDAVGEVLLEAGSMSCTYFYINDFSSVKLEGGVLRIDGPQASVLSTYIANDAVVSPGTGIIRVTESSKRTLVYAVHPDSKQTYPTFFGYSQDWFDPENFQNDGVPNVNDEVWLNTANTHVIINTNQVAMARQLIVGRKQSGIELELLAGSELVVGDMDAQGVLFAGQYEGGEGLITISKDALVTVFGEVAIGVGDQSSGGMDMAGGAMVIHGRFKAGRYNGAIGRVTVQDGTIVCDDFEINDSSTIQIDHGAVITVNKNVENRINNYVTSGQLLSVSGVVDASYDGTTTTISVLVVPTPNPTTQTPTPSPTAPPSPAPWDVAGILSFTESEVGPIMPEIFRDENLRSFTPVPVYGVHPRVFFGPEEIPNIRDRLLDTNSPMSIETMKQFEVYTTSMRLGRASYNALPNDIKYLPSGKQRISNPGLFDTSTSFNELVNGVTTNLAAQTHTHRNALAGVMAIEAFYCVVFEDIDNNVVARASNLAAAMDTWARWAVSQPSFNENDRDLGGGQHMAFAYDLLFNFMTTSQQAHVRKAIATMLWSESTFAAQYTTPHAVQSNWVTLNSFVSSMVMAIEGDVVDPAADNDWSNERLSFYFRDIMKANYNFLTYGWYSNGEPYEGMGKNYQYNMMMVPYAKRGYNFFTHPHVQKYAFDYLLAQMQPFGHYVTTYDAIGGSGWDPELGGNTFKAVDIIALKHAYPTHPGVDFALKNFVETPYHDINGELVTQLSVDADKVSVRSTYENSFLSLLVMGADYENGDFTSQNQSARSSLTFAGTERGLIVTNSDYSPESLELQFHVRQDMGGHTMADRNNFVLSGHGRVWVRLPLGYIYETQWTNGILVNDEGIPITKLDGTKARQPARLAHLQDEELATFATGDATYAYNTYWSWNKKLPDQDYSPSGFTPVEETWNDFRRSDNKIQHSFGDIPFYDYPHWWVGGYLERIVKTTANDMRQVYRAAGMIRGTYPYVLIVDDLEKETGGSDTNYKWITQIPEDLTLMPVADYPSGLDASRDAVLMEPSSTGNRRMLIRVLNAEGAAPNGVFDLDESITYYQWGHDRVAKRFLIERLSQLPRFRVLLYPFVEGDALPRHIDQGNGVIEADWAGEQRDLFTFTTQNQVVGTETVEITAITVVRNGMTLVDTSGQVEPNPLTS